MDTVVGLVSGEPRWTPTARRKAGACGRVLVRERTAGGGVRIRHSNKVRTYELSGGNTWDLKSTMTGNADEYLGSHGVSLSDDGNLLVVGSGTFFTASLQSHMEWCRSSRGRRATKEAGDTTGIGHANTGAYAFQVSGNGKCLVYGDMNDASSTGRASVVRTNCDPDPSALPPAGSWIQRGTDIDGEAAGDYSGWSVALSGHGNRVAIGAILNGGTGTQAGHARVYELVGRIPPPVVFYSHPGVSSGTVLALTNQQLQGWNGFTLEHDWAMLDVPPRRKLDELSGR